MLVTKELPRPGIEKIDSITKEPVTIPAIIGPHKLPPEESRFSNRV